MMIKVRSKMTVAAGIVIVCSLMLAGGVLAYLIHYDSAANTFIVGSQVSEINEVWNPPDSFVKGQRYTKDVKVKNTGTSPCYVRIFAETQDPGMDTAIAVDWNTSNWSSKQSDGYYYYNDALEPGETTEPLFTTITAEKDLSEFGMIVFEESVQAAGADSPQGAFE